MIGIEVNGLHSWSAFRCRVASRNIGQAKKNRITERVPHSNAVYNFSTICGVQTYGERTLKYVLVFLCDNGTEARNRIRCIRNWLDYSGYQKLYDDMEPDIYYMAEATDVNITEQNNLYKISVTFAAEPHAYPRYPSTPSTSHFPDLNADGIVDANDGAIALAAAAQIGAGNPSGLTPEQEAAVDTNGDGVLDAVDANNIMRFAALAGAGNYTNDQAGWTRYMNDQLAQEEGII
ncbi:MAG: hypothetical protein IJN57_05330 [Oscillospiraceae bacterium]|nr:hypothetical protein [Oscillospiraceae bacterium]